MRPGVLFLNNRYHDPLLGGFVSVDPLVATTWEPYIYGAANPIAVSDPTGLCGTLIDGKYHLLPGCYQETPGGRPDIECANNGCGEYGDPRLDETSLDSVAAPPTPAELEAALDAFVNPGAINLLTGAPPRPDDPLEAALWDYVYGPLRGDPDILDALARQMGLASEVLADQMGFVSDVAGGVALTCAGAAIFTAGATMACTGAAGTVSLTAGAVEAGLRIANWDPSAPCKSIVLVIDAMTPVPGDAPAITHLVHGTFLQVAGSQC